MNLIATQTPDDTTEDTMQPSLDSLRQPLVIVDPNKIEGDEAEALRRDGFAVPAPEPKASIWK